MDPISIIGEAIAGINAIVNIIHGIKAQNGLTDDQILAAADAQTTANTALIKQLLAGLPPTS
jgi:hypothetical protein